MRYVPSTRVGSLVMASVRHAATHQDVHPHLAEEVLARTLKSVEQHEARLSPNAGFVAVNDKMSEVFLNWATALDAGDGKLAAKLEEELDTLSVAHPFTYAESKREFYSNYTNSSYDAAKQNYREWDGTDPTFAVVANTVSGSGKVAVIGDWGTGEEDAKVLLEAVMAHSPDVILHLGDIYEAGLPVEIEEYFVKPINEVCGNTRPPIFTIPGNHEYFSGAKGYFELIDVLNGGSTSDWHQEASFFCLRSDDGKYQFLGADSGLDCIKHSSCPHLLPSEIDWHRARIAEFSGKTVFMTHHQFTAVDHKINRDVYGHPSDYGFFNRHFVDAFNQTIPGTSETYLDRIDLWLWGHAHWFVSFKQDMEIPISTGSNLPKLRRGQLLGGSARENTRGNAKMRPEVRPWVTHTGDITPGGLPGTGSIITPGATNSDGTGGMLFNHTYAIMDLGSGEIAYYQTPAWTKDTLSPDKTPLKAPILTLPV